METTNPYLPPGASVQRRDQERTKNRRLSSSSKSSRPRGPANLTRRENLVLSGPQSEVFLDQARFKVVVAGRRWGKTRVAISKLAEAAGRKQDGNFWYVGPTYTQSKMIVWKELKRITQPIWDRRPNESELVVTLRNGSEISVKGASNADSLRGPGLNGLILDEFADIAPSAWEEVLRPMLSDRQGWAWFIGTPKGRNHFFDLFTTAQSREGWATFQFTTLQGGWVPREEVEQARAELDPRSFRQEYEATFENYSGVVYYTFERGNDVESVVFDPMLPVLWTLDFNIDPMMSCICQIPESGDGIYFPKSRSLNVLDEIVLRNGSTVQACQEFAERALKLYRGHQPLRVVVYGDASGNSRSTTTGSSDWDMVRSWFSGRREFSVKYEILPANPQPREFFGG